MNPAAGNQTSPLKRYASSDFLTVFQSHLDSLKTSRARANYTQCVGELLSYMQKDFLRAEHCDIQSYFDMLSGENKRSQIKRLSILRAVARRCDEHFGSELISSFTGVTAASAEDYVKLTDLPTFSDIGKLLRYLKETGKDQLYAIVSLALETGLSTDELCALCYKNCFYDPSGQRFLLLEGVNMQVPDRMLPLKSDTADLIETLGARREHPLGEDPIFVNSRGGALSERVLQGQLHAACLEAGIKPFGIAKCRSLAIASMMANGAPVSSLSYQLNLTDRWFYRYNEVVKDLKESAVGKNPLSASHLSEQALFSEGEE